MCITAIIYCISSIKYIYHFPKFLYSLLLCVEGAFLNIYTGEPRRYSSNLNLEEISVNLEVSTRSPLAHRGLPWEIKPTKLKKPCDNPKPKKRKFVVLKTSKLQAFALMFSSLAFVVFGFQVIPIKKHMNKLK